MAKKVSKEDLKEENRTTYRSSRTQMMLLFILLNVIPQGGIVLTILFWAVALLTIISVVNTFTAFSKVFDDEGLAEEFKNIFKGDKDV